MTIKPKILHRSTHRLSGNASFVEVARADPEIKRMKRLLKRGAFSLDIEALRHEIDNMHVGRLVRRLKTLEVIQQFQLKFVEAALQNQAYRSRIVEIKLKCYKTSALLGYLLEELRKRLNAEYREKLSAYRTVRERESAIESVLARGLRKMAELDGLIEYGDLVIADIDQASWMLKSVQAAMAMSAEHKSARF